jgi:pimeloyl-ACP methyl ester carboxylesterase
VRFEETFGAEPGAELLTLWDLSREMTARITWKPWMWTISLPTLLRGVVTPALVVWGDDDCVVPRDCGEQYAELLVNGRLELMASCGHLVDLEQPAELVAQVMSLIAVYAS